MSKNNKFADVRSNSKFTRKQFHIITLRVIESLTTCPSDLSHFNSFNISFISRFKTIVSEDAGEM